MVAVVARRLLQDRIQTGYGVHFSFFFFFIRQSVKDNKYMYYDDGLSPCTL